MKWLLGGVALLSAGFLACAVGLFVAERNAGALLDAKQREAQAEADRLHALAQAPRQVLVEEPVQEGNAVDYYLAVRALCESDPAFLPLSEWETWPPNWPWDFERVQAEVEASGAADPDAPMSALGYGIDAETEAPSEGQFQRALREYQRLRPALRYVRLGVRQGHCDWGYAFASGVEDATGRTPGFEVFDVATMLAYEAKSEPPREALETGLVILAYGRDLARHPSLLGLMFGVFARRVGLQSIAHTMGRPGLTREDYVWAREVLGSCGPGDPALALAGERLSIQVEILKVARRPLKGYVLGPPGAAKTPLQTLFSWDIARAHLWGDYETYFQRELELIKLPREEAEAEREAIAAELESSKLHLLTRIFTVSIRSKLEYHQLTQHGHRILAVLAEAHLRRLETGSFPDEEPIPPGEDPDRARPWSYSLEEGRAYCRPVTFDGEGGPPSVGEGAFLSTAAPK